MTESSRIQRYEPGHGVRTVDPKKRPLPPTYFLVAIIVMIAAHLLFPLVTLISTPWRYLGALPLLMGVVLNLCTDRLFKKYGTEVKPFRDSSALILEGSFRFSRNPMYVGALMILIGICLLLGSATPFAVVPIIFWLATVHFIVPEEGDLERQFGDNYLEYKRRVRRWL